MTHIKKATPADLGKLAIVRKGTKVRMVENELPRCRRWYGLGNQWVDVLGQWADKGAQIELYLQLLGEDARNAIEDLRKRGYGSALRVYTIADVSEDMLGKKRKELSDHHFAIFQNPDQLWTERLHKPGDKCMYGCDYHKDSEAFPISRKRKPMWYAEFNRNRLMLDRILKYKSKKKTSRRVAVKR